MPRLFYRFIAEAVEASRISERLAAEGHVQESAMTEEAIAESADVDIAIQEAIIEERVVTRGAGNGENGRKQLA